MGGTLVTAGGLVFWGDDTILYALDAETGNTLWALNLGGKILTAPMTYQVNEMQRVAVVAGTVLFVFGLP